MSALQRDDAGRMVRPAGLDAEFQAAGAAVDPLVAQEYGQRELILIDSDGTLLKFGEPLNSP